MTELHSLLVAPIYDASRLTGGGQRTFHLYRALIGLGAVDLLLISEEACAGLEAGIDDIKADFPGARSVTVLRSREQFVAPPANPASRASRWGNRLRRLAHALLPRAHFYRPTARAVAAFKGLLKRGEHNVVVVRYLQCAALSGALAQREVPVIVDLDDLEEKVLESRIASPTTSAARRALLRWHAIQIRPVAKRLRASSAQLLTANESDRAWLSEPSALVLPNIPLWPDPASRQDAADTRRGPVVLFVGTYRHRINQDGVLRFIECCWPLIRERVEGATLRVVGSGGWERERGHSLDEAGVAFVGQVADLALEYSGASLCVVPIYEGSGTKIKVLEALMYGRAVVATAHSAHGFDRLLGHGLVAAEDDREMVNRCVRWLENSNEREAAAALGRARVAADYSFAAVEGAMRAALQNCSVLPGCDSGNAAGS